MKYLAILPLLASLCSPALGQTRIILTGKVVDAVTNEPLSFATVGVKYRSDEVGTDSMGAFSFSIPKEYANDTLIVRYIGYKDFSKPISALQSIETIHLEEAYTLLQEVIIVTRKLNLRDTERMLRVIRGKLYAMSTEVINADYNYFLNYLEEHDQRELLKVCSHDLSSYNESEREFFRRYSAFTQPKQARGDTIVVDYSGYPVVNISHEAAVKYCEWLTDLYNLGSGKRKFKQVKFRLPTLQEWQIAALGYPRFQSWVLEENRVEVVVPDRDSVIEFSRGTRKTIHADGDILYPWYVAYNYRKKPSNSFHCYLGNFKVESVYKPCPSKHRSFDGFIAMGRCASYFPNNMGLYDVVGNIAEMIDQQGKACGGSWNDWPSQSTIHSVKEYSRPDASIGFRVFMEVLEK